MKTINSNIWKKISDAEFIEGLKHNNRQITEAFFFGLCNYTLNDIRLSVMQNAVDYDDLVSELYLYLSENQWHRLDTFGGVNGCSLRTWIIRVAWRYLMSRRDFLLGKVTTSTDDLQIPGDTDMGLDVAIAIDVAYTLERMERKLKKKNSDNQYVNVLRLTFIEGYEPAEIAKMLNTTVSNVYNLKHRAIVQFVEFYNADE